MQEELQGELRVAKALIWKSRESTPTTATATSSDPNRFSGVFEVLDLCRLTRKI